MMVVSQPARSRFYLLSNKKSRKHNLFLQGLHHKYKFYLQNFNPNSLEEF